jgi:hypothetical protein
MGSSGLSVSATVIFILNIVIGYGLFLNTNILFNLSGAISFFSYFLGAALMAPLIFSCGLLTKIFPGKNLYESIRLGGNFSGSVVTIAFSICKMGSAVLAALFSLRVLSGILGFNEKIVFFPFVLLLSIFSYLIISGFTLKSWVQNIISILKFFPLILFILFGVKYIFARAYIDFDFLSTVFSNFQFDMLMKSVPIVLLSFAGFEAIFSITENMRKPKESFISLIYSFFLMFFICLIYQASVSITLSDLSNQICTSNFFELCSSFGRIVGLPLPLLEVSFLAIIISVFGSVYNIFFATTQNIFQLIKTKKKINYSMIVLPSLIYAVSIGYLFAENTLALHQNSVLGLILLYVFISYVAIFKVLDLRRFYNLLFAFFIIVSITFLSFAMLVNINTFGKLGYLLHFSILIFSIFLTNRVKL